MEEKKFIITGDQRDEILNFLKTRNYSSARNSLMQLISLEEELKEIELIKSREVKNGDIQKESEGDEL